MEADKSKISRIGQQVEDQVRDGTVEVCPLNAVHWQNFLLLEGGQSFVLFKPSSD